MKYEIHVGEVYEKYEGTPQEIAELLRIKEKEEETKTFTTHVCVTGPNGKIETVEVTPPKILRQMNFSE